MKFKIQYLVIILLLILFPLISWLYLKNGISFRRQALEQLSSITSFNNNILDSATLSQFTGKIALIEINGSQESLVKINDQFKESSDFVILSSKSGYKVQLGNNEISNLKAEFPGKSYILIDNEGKVRRTYMDNSDNEMKQLVIHIATLIPFVEKKKPRGIK